MTINKLLIANRGEIACRIIRTARGLGIGTVAVHSDADADALHVAMADEAVWIGPAPVAESYLQGEAIIAAAQVTGADAIHPGYGFLAENPDFVEAVTAAGLIFIGPPAEAIRAMGLKDRAKALMAEAGVPVVPGYHGPEQNPDFLAGEADAIGYPVLIKARAGGGGKGMRRVDRAEDFAEALASAQREAQSAFGDPACLIEKYILAPRHVEMQVFADAHGNVVHLFERDCSLQRRHQKVIEEAPAPGMSAAMRAAMGRAAVAAAQAVGYVGAGTVEFIADGTRFPAPDAFWFMEMNTRLQVEHPVTEAITGLDLVALQIAVAEGRPLPFAQDDLAMDGHAVEARLYAEDAAAGFLPATGRLTHLDFPAGEGLRVDTGVRAGDAITPFYDPMIAKIIAHAPDRATALRRLHGALSETVIAGSVTNRGFLCRLVQDDDFAAGRVDTGLIERRQDALTAEPAPEAADFALAALALLQPQAAETGDPFAAFTDFRLFGPARRSLRFEGAEPVTVTLEMAADGSGQAETPLGALTIEGLHRSGTAIACRLDGVPIRAHVVRDGAAVLVQRGDRAPVLTLKTPGRHAEEEGGDAVLAPMPGLVRQVDAAAGQRVAKGARLIVLEAMKMEHALAAPRDGIVAELLVAEGDQVDQGAALLRLEAEA